MHEACVTLVGCMQQNHRERIPHTNHEATMRPHCADRGNFNNNMFPMSGGTINTITISDRLLGNIRQAITAIQMNAI